MAHTGPKTVDAGGTIPPELEERRGFLSLRDEDLRRLTRLHDLFRDEAGGVVERFYEHLLSYPSLSQILGDSQQVERLKKLQYAYILSLTSGRLDQDYLDNRLRIGRAHERIGLQPQWYMGAYGILLDELCQLIHAHFGKRTDSATKTCMALTKLMNLDTQIVLHAYFGTRQQKALEKSEQLAAVGELAASIAHEVRNPLAGMKGALEVLRHHLAKDPSRVEIADELLAQIERLENLVRDLLTYARPRPLSRQPVELHHLLDRVVRIVKEEVTGEAIQWRYSYTEDFEKILADPQQLEQVFLNLIQNAVQAMENGGCLTIRTRRLDQHAEIAFQDTGQGIKAADMERIFQPFFTTRHRGSGLGLAIVRKIVERHGGDIQMESRAAEGTTALVLLPLEAIS